MTSRQQKTTDRPIIVSWVGNTDINAARKQEKKGGPLLSVLANEDCDEMHLLHYAVSPDDISLLQEYLASVYPQVKCVFYPAQLRSPTDFKGIYDTARDCIEKIVQRTPKNVQLTASVTSGTPAMCSVWILLGQQGYRLRLVQVRRDGQPGPQLEEINQEELTARAAFFQGRQAGASGRARLVTPVALARVYDDGVKIAPSDLDVLIRGETGTGKEILASFIHEHSRRTGAMVSVNCGAIPRELFESAMFGHMKGSFTGAIKNHNGHFVSANNGTIFLDEIGELSLDLQVKLLRVLEERKVTPVGAAAASPVDVRVISATNRNLIAMVNEGAFRSDLYFRIAGYTVLLPSLREWDDDSFREILDAQLQDVCAAAGIKTPPTLDGQAMETMRRYPWQGNIRELKSVLKRLVVMAAGRMIKAEDVRPCLVFPDLPEAASPSEPILGPGFDAGVYLEEQKRMLTRMALEQSGDRVTAAAKLLGIPQPTCSKWKKDLSTKALKPANQGRGVRH